MAVKRRQAGLQNRAAARTANSRRRKKRRTGKRTLHYILLVLFVLGAGAVLSLTTFFKVDSITVVGTDKYTPEEIQAASGIIRGDNMLRLSAATVEERLLQEYPYIESVEIGRKLPPAIEIRITQSEPAAALLEGTDIVLITRDGKVLERGQLFVPPHVPLVKGISTQKANPGEYLGKDAEEGLRMLEYLLQAVEETGFDSITNVDVSDPLNMYVVYENRLLLKLGTEADLDHKLNFIRTVLDKLEPEQQGRLDASDAKTRKRIVRKDITLEEALALEWGIEKTEEPETGDNAPDMPSFLVDMLKQQEENTDSEDNGV